MTREALLKLIEDYAHANDLAPATVTGRAVGNSRLYARLKGGGGCTIQVVQRLCSFIETSTAEDAA